MTTISQTLIRPDDRIISLTGAGGKTSLMFLLAHELQQRGEKIITTTTTRIRHPLPEQSARILLDEETDIGQQLERLLATTGHVTIAAGRLPDGKLAGISCRRLQKISAHSQADRLLIEADGARGLSLKAPGDNEPVVPDTTDCCIAVIGLDCIGKALTEKNVFRPGQISLLTGLQPGKKIIPEIVASLITHPRGLFKSCPKKATRIIFLNKTDITGGNTRAAQIIQATVKAAGRLPDALFAGSIRNNTCLPAFCIPQVR